MESRQRRRWPRVLAWLSGALVVLLAVPLVIASVIYPVEYVRRIVVWGESDVGDYLNNFPQRPLRVSSDRRAAGGERRGRSGLATAHVRPPGSLLMRTWASVGESSSQTR